MSELIGAATALGGAAVTSQVAWFIPMLVGAIAFFQYEMMDPESRAADTETDELMSEYDFIIVGSGSAGKIFDTFSTQNFIIMF